MLQRDINNRYEIINYLGEGTLGSVYLCQDYLRQNKRVAVKVISNEVLANYETDKLLLFRQEFTIMERMSHPNIANVFDFGFCPENKHFYIAREYINGVDLSQILNYNKTINLDNALEIVIPLLRALDFIHSREVIYRDMTMENIIFPYKDIDNRSLDISNFDISKPVLFEFGISTIKGKRILQKGNIKNELLAPEILENNQYNFNSDIFSLGVLFYEIISGHQINDQIKKLKINTKTFPIDNYIRKMENSELVKILLRMTSFDPELRYQTCSEVIEDINKRLNKRFKIETTATALSYIKKPIYIKRKSELCIFDDILKSTRSKFYLLVSDKGSGKSRIIDYLRKKVSIANRLVFSIDCFKYSSYSDFFSEYLRLLLPYTSKKIIDEYLSLYNFYKIDTLHSRQILTDFFQNYDENDSLLVKDTIEVILHISNHLVEDKNMHIKESVLLLDNFHHIEDFARKAVDALIFHFQNNKNPIKIIFSCLNDENFLNSKFGSRFGKEKEFKKYQLEAFNNKQIKLFLENCFGKNRISKKLLSSTKILKSKTLGNPLFIQEILENLVRTKKITKRKHVWDIHNINEIEACDNILDLFSAKLDNLGISNKQKKLLLKLSLLQEEFTCQLLATLSDLEWEEVMELLELCISENILSYGESGIRVESPLLKDFVLHFLDKSKINELHYDLSVALYELIDIYLEDEIGKVKKACVFHFCSCESSYVEKIESNYKKELFDNCISITKDYFKSYKFKEVLKNIDFISVAGKRHISSYENIELLLIKGQILSKYGKIKNAENLFLKCYKFLRKNPEQYFDLLGTCLKELALLYQQTSDYERSIEYADFILAYENFKHLHIEAYSIIGNCRLNIGQYEEAYENFKMQRELAKKLRRKKAVAEAVGNIGLYFWFKRDIIKAKECYELQLEQLRKFSDTNLLIKPLGNLAIIYNSEANYKKALDYYYKVVKIASKYHNKIILTKTYSNIGSLYLNIGDYQKAKKHLQKSLKFSHDSNLLKTESVIYFNFAELYKDLGKYKKAGENYKKAAEIIFKLNLTTYIPSICLEASDLFFRIGDIGKSLEFFNNSYLHEQIEMLSIRNQILYKILEIVLSEDIEEKKENLLKDLLANTKDDESRAVIHFYLYLLNKKHDYLVRAISVYKHLFRESKNNKYSEIVKHLSKLHL